ncbi:nucleoside monophosphate kinase [Patescibacteria group bacterium]|nr:nucleoside monophosphate kinase [Patescibacteria group bacterium]
MDFPYFNSRELSVGGLYDLGDPVERFKYFHSKLGSRIDEVKEFLEHNSFVGFMLAKKLGGKGTYAKMLQEILGEDRLSHVSVGDIVREVHAELESENGVVHFKENLLPYYRGMLSIDEAVGAIFNRSQDKVSVPTEMVLALLKMKIDEIGKKALLIDGMPRTNDQISYSLFFRDLINHRTDPDFFLLMDVDDAIIELRLTGRVICPVCHTSRNIVTNPTTIVRYDARKSEYYCVCDNKGCPEYKKARYVGKEGDSKGIETITDRLKEDQKLIQMSFGLHGIPKVLIGSSLPVDIAHDYLEDYEIQPRYRFSGKGDDVSYTLEPWIFTDEKGRQCYTYRAATFVLNIFVQLHRILIGE